MKKSHEIQEMEMIDLNRPAPTTEPERQYYFIKKVQEYVKAQSEKRGVP